MKKLIAILSVSLLLCAFTLNVLAKYDAFSKIEVTPDVTLIDDDTTQDKGGSGQPIQYVDGYGVGYSSLNDIVYFSDVDFGANGAKQMTIYFSYGNDDDSTTTLNVYIDDYKNSSPVCSYDIGYTGGWESTKAQEFTADCTIPSGVHTVYIQFTNDKSGSFTYIDFTQAEPAQTAAPETAAVTETPAITAAQTADVSIIVAAVSLAAVSAYIAIVKNKKA
jgi:Carbohydrate binding module (family 6).